MTTKTQRIINFLIDTVIYFAFLITLLLIFRDQIPKEHVKWISILIYFLYYFNFEYILGQTPAKMVTRTKVTPLGADKEYYFIRIALRTLMRFIPLDILSYLFSERGLHDWISKTTITKR